MLPDLFSPPFDYAYVDGVGRARQRNIVPKLDGKVLRGTTIGPLIEFGHLGGGSDADDLGAASWFDAGSLGPLLSAMATGPEQWLQADGRCGFIKGIAITNEALLTSFKIDAHKAARAAGFGKAAALLIAAMGELIGNISDHSQAEETGIAALLSRPGSFEFVVADRGIGALQSLRQSPDYTGLGDHGEALAEMIESGVSRYGADRGHGNGFQPIFERLADMQGHLRFRSGDYSLTLDGRFGDRIARQISQRPRLSGFLAAVSCHRCEKTLL